MAYLTGVERPDFRGNPQNIVVSIPMSKPAEQGKEWYCTGCGAHFDEAMVTVGPPMCPKCFIFDIMQVKKPKAKRRE
jgi:hypothetical protein